MYFLFPTSLTYNLLTDNQFPIFDLIKTQVTQLLMQNYDLIFFYPIICPCTVVHAYTRGGCVFFAHHRAAFLPNRQCTFL